MKQLKLEELIVQIFEVVDQNFRGSILVKTSNTLQWQFFFRLGHCSWVTGGANSNERLQRHLALFCPQITPAKLKEIATEQKSQLERSIVIQLQIQKLIERQGIARLMTSTAIEILFDVIQYSETTDEKLTYKIFPEDENYNLCLLLPVLEFEPIFSQAKQAWEEWQNLGLKNYSPNLYPVIKQPLLLQQKVTNERELQILSLIDGKQTLRSIAFKSKIKTLNLTRFLISLVNLGAMEFSTVPSTQQVEFAVTDRSSNSNEFKSEQTSSARSPLVVCVDDSPLVCKALEKIVVGHNYRYMSIQDSIQVIPLLLKNKQNKPNFIFLDLMMPVVNGYELCTQLRRAPSFQDIPIVILTGKDGLVDRMRAKLAGSTDFMSKPVEESAVLSMLEKHLNIRR